MKKSMTKLFHVIGRPAKLAALLLVATLVIAQVGPFGSIWLETQASSAITPVNQWVTVNGSGVNVRSSPGLGGTIQATLNTGHRLYAYTAQPNDGYTWYLVTYVSGNVARTGYVASEFTRTIATSPSGDAAFESAMTAQGFPESYKPALRQLHALYPNWTFKAKQTQLDWNTVLNNESVAFRSVIPGSYNSSLRSTDPVTYNASTGTWIDGSGKVVTSYGWVMANRNTLSFYMDPRNMLDGSRVFMFEKLSYQPQIHTAAGINLILQNTFMGEASKFLHEGKQITHADAFIAAAQQSNVSPFHLASRARQEVVLSGGLPSGSVTGTYSTSYPNVFNYFNIGAIDSGDPVLHGLQWALLGPDRNAIYTTTDAKYLIPWQDGSGQSGRYKSIVGGAKYIGNTYINVGQDSLYLQKFDVDNSDNSLYWHQYMTNITAPYAESASIFTSYRDIGAFQNNFVFEIPVYLNMPDQAVPLPAGNGNVNNYLSSLAVKGKAVSPAFKRDVTSGYSVTVPFSVSTLNLTSDIAATTEAAGAVVSVQGPTTLAVGSNAFTATVRASHGNDPRVYRFTVVREPSPDTVPPVITLAYELLLQTEGGTIERTPILAADLATLKTRGDIRVTATADEGSVLDATEYTFVANGSFTFTATDSGNNVTRQTVTITGIDKQPPDIPQVQVTPETLTNKPVEVRATFASDVTVKQYRLSTDTVWSTYTDPVSVVENNTTVLFRGQDAAGNWSTIAERLIANIDKTPPAIPSATLSPASETAGPVVVTASFSADSIERQYRILPATEAATVTGTDPEVEWIPYSEPLSIAKNSTVEFRGLDAAGNESDILTVTINTIIEADPTPTPTPTPGPTPDPTPTPTPTPEPVPPVITLEPYTTDPTNQSVTIKASVDKGQLNARSITFEQNGTFEFVAIDYDVASDSPARSSRLTITISHIDKIAPAAPVIQATPLELTNQPVSVSATFESGAAARQYRHGLTGTWTDYDGPISVDSNGAVYFRQRDEAGNWSATSSIEISNIDRTPPSQPTATANPTTPSTGPVTVTASFSLDSMVRVSRVGPDTEWKPYVQPIVLSENGTVAFKAQDLAGNWSAETTVTISSIAAPTPTPTPIPTPTPAPKPPSSDNSSGGSGGGDDDAKPSGGSIQSSTLKISGTTITGLNPATDLNTLSSFTSKVTVPSGSTLTVRTPGGSILTSASARIGTGYQIQVVAGSKVQASYTAIVYGDTNGDGQINIMDVATLFKFVRNKQDLGSPYQQAGDTDRNTKVNIADVATTFKHVRNKTTIVQ
jgi:beta-N-acetylglucosaminidase